MSLALLRVPVAEFHLVRNHLLSKQPRYQNMHLREARVRGKTRVMRHLHAMYAPHGQSQLEGMISGPGVFWHYRLILANGQTQTQVLAEEASAADAVRLRSRFLRDVLDRVQMERAGQKYSPTRISGQLYLRRLVGGTPASAAVCQDALQRRELDQRFLSRLATWDLSLFRH